jgi:hypothetical protein
LLQLGKPWHLSKRQQLSRPKPELFIANSANLARHLQKAERRSLLHFDF